MRRNRLAITVFLLLCLPAIHAGAQVWAGPAGVEIQVSSKGKPVAGARVVLRYREAPTGSFAVLTDNKGRAAVVNLAPGAWNIEVSHPDYLSYVAAITLIPGKKADETTSFLQATGEGRQPIRVKYLKAQGPIGTPVEAPAPPPRSEPIPTPTPTPPPAAVEPEPEPVELRQPDIPSPSAPEPEPEPEVEEPPAAVSETPEPELQEPDIPAPSAPIEESEPLPEPQAPARPEQPQLEPEIVTPPAPEPEAPLEPEPQPEPEPEPEPTLEPPAELVQPEPPAPEPTSTSVPAEAASPAPAPETGPTIEEPAPEPAETPEPKPSVATEPIAEQPIEPEPEPEPMPAPAVAPTLESPPEPEAPPAPERPEPEPEESLPPQTEIDPAPALPPEPQESPREQPIPEPERPEAPRPEVVEPAAPVQPEPEPPLPSEPEPAPTVEPAEDPVPEAEPEAAPAPAAPRPPSPSLRAYRDRTCPECKPGEWSAASVEVAEPAVSGSCPSDATDQARRAARLIARAPKGALTDFAGPAIGGVSPTALELVPGEVRSEVGEAMSWANSACRLLAVSVPRGAKFAGFRYEAADDRGQADCVGDQDCPVGDSRFLGNPGIERGAEVTVVWAVFENRSSDRQRRARLTAYFVPASGWRP